MADDISQVVEVYISRETAQIDTASFDIPLLMVNLPDTIDNSGGSPVTVPADTSQRVRVYRDLKTVGEDFGVDSAAYKMTQKLLGNDIGNQNQADKGCNNRLQQTETTNVASWGSDR